MKLAVSAAVLAIAPGLAMAQSADLRAPTASPVKPAAMASPHAPPPGMFLPEGRSAVVIKERTTSGEPRHMKDELPSPAPTKDTPPARVQLKE
jgi:hypothetical protein